jgi:hypothetical protein
MISNYCRPSNRIESFPLLTSCSRMRYNLVNDFKNLAEVIKNNTTISRACKNA